MHFQSQAKQRCELMMELIEVLLECNEISDSAIKLHSVEQLINEHKLDKIQRIVLKFNDLKRKIYEFK
jgi:hypothetical protein